MAEAGVFEVAGFTFTSNFDSGNLAHVQLSSPGTSGLVTSESDIEAGLSSPSRSGARPSTSTAQLRSAGIENPDHEFQLWTRPDCQGTEFENGNRTWFFFGLKGGPVGAVLKFTVMNMNKQSKLFSQGMAPVFRIQGKSNWERIRDLPTYSSQENNFTMSFKFRNIEEPNCLIFFAFTYPYTYKELQTDLGKLEKKYSNANLNWSELQSLPSTSIYFNRELVIKSLESRRLDLITISGMNNIVKAKEPTLTNLFPDQDGSRRPHKFSNKKTVFLSARVHPGETCSSFVINGFIRFLLNSTDLRAAALRSKYVFKLVPMLNPDGVFRGHYRTDTRGVNLNRVYLDPSPSLHPTIYSAKKLILLAHLGVPPAEETVSINSLIQPSDGLVVNKSEEIPDLSDTPEDTGSGVNLPTYRVSESEDPPDLYKPLSLWDIGKSTGSGSRGRSSTSSRVSNSSRTSHCSTGPGSGLTHSTPVKSETVSLQWYEMTETSRCSEGDESVADFSVGPSYGIGTLFGAGEANKCEDAEAFLPPEIPSSSSPSKKSRFGRTSFAGMFEKGSGGVGKGAVDNSCNLSQELGSSCLQTVTGTVAPPTGESGLFLYVDIHGHASKRGIFMYGNHFEELESKVSALLYPKIMSINSANFDFPACNFTAKNMYMKDRHTGAGKEGSGRVSIFKATGLIYCYTLECNFNTGRFTNSVPLSSRDCGRASPPPIYDHPPKYCPDIYDQCGRYLAVSILDLTESNPWTRLPCSSSKTLKGVRNTIKQWLKAAETEAASKSGRNAKSSPMRTRLRSLSTSKKKSPLKQLQLLKSPSSPELALGSASHQVRPLSKQTRKNISPKHSQSVPSKLGRQNSRSSSAKSAEPTKKKRIGSGKKLKGNKLSGGAKSGGGTKSGGSKPGSRSGSRASSPRRNKSESKSTKSKVSQKKVLKKAAWKSLADPLSSDNVVITSKKLKRKKKKVSNLSM